MIESISAITLATHEMPRAVRFYRALGFEILHGGEQSPFTSFRAGTGYLNLIAQPAERRWSWWGRVIFYVADVDALYERALAAGYRPAAQFRATSASAVRPIAARSDGHAREASGE
jgi:catechol 2,3-dioxygenase-like lactoylglutathione lyase family enzyme